MHTRPPRTESRFRFRELARAVKAAKAAGGERVDVDPVSGRISVFIGKGDVATEMQTAATKAWDDATEKLTKQKATKAKSASTRRS